MKVLKRSILFIAIISMQNIFAESLDAFLSVNRFYNEIEQVNYIELSYLVPSLNLKFEKENDQFQAKLKVNCSLKIDKRVLEQVHYILQSKKFNSLENINHNLTDVIRLKTTEGDSIWLYIDIEDLNNENLQFKDSMQIYIPKRVRPFLSDIMLVKDVFEIKNETVFDRNSLTVIPKFLNYYPTEIETLQFYCEMYSKEKSDFILTYLITNEQGVFVDGYSSFKRIENKSYEVIISGFDLTKLPSGNYYIFVELKDKENKMIERKRTFFQRNNKNKEVEENVNIQKNELDVITNNFARKYDLRNIKHHAQALKAISGHFERATLESFAESENLTQIQNFFYSFWHEKNPKDPEAEWNAYAKRLQYVEEHFTTLSMRGYESDRGMVYLKYGKPFYKQLKRGPQIGEIWIWNYEFINGESDIYFIFQNRDDITDEYSVVHSNLNGEIFDKNWAEYLKNNF